MIDAGVYVKDLERKDGVLEREYEQIAVSSPVWGEPVKVYRRRRAEEAPGK